MAPESASGADYFCRGCGEPLPSGFEGLFHPACLKADKRRRVREARQKLRGQFERWLSRQRCPDCGTRLDHLLPMDVLRPDDIPFDSRGEAHSIPHPDTNNETETRIGADGKH